MAEHIEGQNADCPRQNPQDALLGFASRVGGVAREILVVLQQFSAGVIVHSQPDTPNDGQFHGYDGAVGPHAIERGKRVRMKTGGDDVELWLVEHGFPPLRWKASATGGTAPRR